MSLVDDHDSVAAQRSVRESLAEEHPISQVSDARVAGRAVVEAHAIADLLTQGHAHFRGDAARDRRRRDPPRLRDADGWMPSVKEVLRI